MIFDLTIFALSDITLSIKVTHLANFFAILISFSSIMILFITKNYKLKKSFYALFITLIASLFLIIYAHDFLLFFVGWEIMSISTYFLLSFTLDKKTLQKYIIFAMASALSLLLSIVILYSSEHSLLYIDAHKSFLALENSKAIFFIISILIAIFIKLGTIGFHYWLVDSYEQSHNLFTPFLSAILSKMGIYALIIVLTQVVDITYPLAILGVISSIIATFKAIQEDSIKRLLAYSSIAQLGYIITILGVYDGMGGALYHSLIHTIIKLLLFINIAGVIFITKETHFSKLGGIIYKTPHSFILMLIAIIALAGIPPLGGFSSKFLIYSSLLETKYLLILIAVMFSSISAFLYIYKLIYGIYLGHPTHKKLETLEEVPFSFLLPQYILAFILIILGLYPAIVVPYFNTILEELHLQAMKFTDYSTLITPFTEFNGTVIFIAFIAIFLTILTLFITIKNKTKKVKNRFDIAYCAELPNENTDLHYGYSIGKELYRVDFIKTILNNSIQPFYEYIVIQTINIAEITKNLYSGKLNINFNITILFVIILFWWSLR